MSFFHSDKPDFVNEIGTKFWKDKILTDHAQYTDNTKCKLDAVCFYVELKTGERTYLLVDKNTNEPIAEEPGIEAMGVKIDVLKFLAQEKRKSTSVSTSVSTRNKRG